MEHNGYPPQVTVPIMWCVKAADFSLCKASKLVGKEVWVVSSEFKERWATLYALEQDCSVVSMLGHPALNIPNLQIAAL